MSDWTENPFGAKDDPFSDPSVTQATSSSVPEYNPFEASSAPAAKSSKASSAPKAAPASKPAAEPVPSWAQAKPAAAPAPQQQAPAPEKKQPQPQQPPFEDPRAKEYQQREEAAQKKDPNFRPPNFPPFPPKCGPFKPCFHIDIKGEIPEWGQKVVKQLFVVWIITCVALTWNFIAALAALDCSDCSETDVTAGVSCAFFLLFVPCSFCCWYHPLYTAMRTDSSLRYGWFFFVFGFQFISSVFMAIGIPGTGASGIIIAAKAVKGHTVVGIMLFAAGILWILLAVADLWYIKTVLMLYRSTGASIDKMKAEWERERNAAILSAATSETGQKAIASAATGAASSWASEA